MQTVEDLYELSDKLREDAENLVDIESPEAQLQVATQLAAATIMVGIAAIAQRLDDVIAVVQDA